MAPDFQVDDFEADTCLCPACQAHFRDAIADRLQTAMMISHIHVTDVQRGLIVPPRDWVVDPMTAFYVPRELSFVAGHA